MYLEINELKSKIPNVDKSLEEVKKSYNAGVNKSAIITLWTAIVVDILEKTQDLQDYNSKAKDKISEVDQVRENLSSLNPDTHYSGIKGMQKIENSILKFAKDDLQIISQRGYIDLARIKEDRNSCAHPSFIEDEIFTPTSEIVRAHITAAWFHLIGNPAVCKKYLLEQIEDLIDPKKTKIWKKPETFSKFINSESISAWSTETLNQSVKMLSGMIVTNKDFVTKKRAVDILEYIYKLKPQEVKKRIRVSLDEVSNQEKKEKYLISLTLAIGHFDGIWFDLFNSEEKNLIETIFEKRSEVEIKDIILKSNFKILINPSLFPAEIESAVRDIINNLTLDEISEILPSFPDVNLLEERTLKIFTECRSYDSSATILKALPHLLNNISVNKLTKFINSYLANSQHHGSYKSPSLLNKIYSESSEHNKEIIKKYADRFAKNRRGLFKEVDHADYSELNFIK